MEQTSYVVKNSGKKHKIEQFDRKILHNSIVKVCLSIYTPEGQAESTANKVCDKVIIWLKNHPEVTGHDIRLIATKQLQKYHPEAAYLYEQHHITI